MELFYAKSFYSSRCESEKNLHFLASNPLNAYDFSIATNSNAKPLRFEIILFMINYIEIFLSFDRQHRTNNDQTKGDELN